MSLPLLPPGLILFAGLVLPLLGRAGRLPLLMGLPLLALALIWQLPADASLTLWIGGWPLRPLVNSELGRLFASVFALLLLGGGLFAYRSASRTELVAAQINAGSAIGVCFAGDLITLFLFWELLALSSTLIIWSAHSLAARRAGMRYLLLHLCGGVVLLAGITGHIEATGNLALTPLRADSSAHALLLCGLLINAGAPPLSAWVADAYPEASPSGSVFLSAFTTKTAVLALILLFPGEPLLIGVGLYMVFYGIIYALLENDLRRILAYSIVSQVGFMVCAVGIGSELALNGAAAHAFVHILYKGLLLMAAGAVLYRTGRRRCTDLGGLFRTMPWTCLLGCVGALAVSAFPFTSGFPTKSLISEAAAEANLLWLWLALTAGSAGTLLYVGLKLPWFVFFQRDSGLRPPEAPRHMRLAMGLFALACVGLGVYPEALYRLLPYPVDYQPYTAAHLVMQLQLLLFAGLAFFALLPQLQPTHTLSLDTDWFYRRFLRQLALEFGSHSRHAHGQLRALLRQRVRALIDYLFEHMGPQGVLARSWPTGSMVLWVSVILALTLGLYYL